MTRHVDAERLRYAQLSGAASGLRGLMRNEPDRVTDIRATWPELAERLDRICELVDWR